MLKLKTFNLIYFEDYPKIYIKLHYEIIWKYILFKILKSNNFDENKSLKLIEKYLNQLVYPNYHFQSYTFFFISI